MGIVPSALSRCRILHMRITVAAQLNNHHRRVQQFACLQLQHALGHTACLYARRWQLIALNALTACIGHLQQAVACAAQLLLPSQQPDHSCTAACTKITHLPSFVWNSLTLTARLGNICTAPTRSRGQGLGPPVHRANYPS